MTGKVGSVKYISKFHKRQRKKSWMSFMASKIECLSWPLKAECLAWPLKAECISWPLKIECFTWPLKFGCLSWPLKLNVLHDP